MSHRNRTARIAATAVGLLLVMLPLSCGEGGENPESAAREFVSAAYSEVSVSPQELCDLMTGRLQDRLVEVDRIETEALNEGLEPITGEVEPLPESCSSAIEGWDEQYGDDRDHPDLSSLHLTGESGEKATASVLIEDGSEPYEKRLELVKDGSGQWIVDAANLNPGESGPDQEPLLR